MLPVFDDERIFMLRLSINQCREHGVSFCGHLGHLISEQLRRESPDQIPLRWFLLFKYCIEQAGLLVGVVRGKGRKFDRVDTQGEPCHFVGYLRACVS